MYKKILLCLLCFLMCGCTKDMSLEDQSFEIYKEIKNNILKQTLFDSTDDFQVSLIYNKINDEYRYDIIIDQPKNVMYDITAMSYAKEAEEEMCPNIGIFDYEPFHLKKDYINKKECFYKGIQLSGTTKIKQNVILYISYYTDKQKINKIEKYIEVNSK